MLKLKSETLEDLLKEMVQRKGEISTCVVTRVLEGLRMGTPSVHIEVESNFGMDIYVDDVNYRDVLETNLNTLLELEEYELANECKNWL
ncbi:hypothetical protein N9E79_00790 [bacterium]|nr:hypothetical protein [bacterium]